MNVVEVLLDLFERGGSAAYFGEEVSQREHALQAAHLARTAGATDDLIAAALLHDIGHLLHGLPEYIAEDGIDAKHEAGGATWLARHFPPTVTEPIRLHVAAKRYLCAVDLAYAETLSAASRRSLELQGGAFTYEQARSFEQHPHHSSAVQLRRWDDQAKIPGLAVPGIDVYRSLLTHVLDTVAKGKA
jgi:gamma-butyrobetaine dioxygenase